MITFTEQPSSPATASDDEMFLSFIPAIERLAAFAFSKLLPQEREEAITEVVANAFCAFRRLAELDKLTVAYASPLARFAILRVRAGRHASCGLNTKDVAEVAAQRRRGFRVESLTSVCFESANWSEALVDDTLTPIPDQVAFRLDFPAWLQGLNQSKRGLAKFLALGNTSSEAAQKFGVSRARVSQLRSELRTSWQSFQGEVSQGTAVLKSVHEDHMEIESPCRK